MSFNPRNILVIDFGQLGDVVMSLPALHAIRRRFPRARITVAAGKPGAEIIDLARCADDTLVVDRVALRDGFKPLSMLRLLQLVRDVRGRRFDFVIDLHSLSETNLLGFLSGAPKRLYSRRPRAWDFLANFSPRPPIEADHRTRHLTDRYLDVLQPLDIPLDIKEAPKAPRLATRSVDDQAIERILKKAKADTGAPLVGLFPGAGHPSRCWPLERFAELADFLERNHGARVLVFAGPEERAWLPAIRDLFPKSALILDRLTIAQLASAQARLSVFVSNDTGPMHVAAAVGSPVVLLLDKRAPESYLPRARRQRVIYSSTIPEITVAEVYAATRELLAGTRAESLFAS